MSIWGQHILAIGATLACAAVVVRMGVKTLRGRGKLGACCARGCGENVAKPQANGERVVFLPAEMLRASKRRDAR